MRKTLLFSFLLTTNIISEAQEKIFECDLNNEVRIPPKAFFISGERNSFHLTLANKKYIKRFEVLGNGTFSGLLSNSEADKNFFKTYKQNDERLDRLYNNSNYITGFKGNNTVTDVLLNNFTSDYYFIETDFNTGNSLVVDTINRSDHEQYIHSFSKNEFAYLITNLKKRDKLIIYKKKFGTPIQSDTVSINFNDGSENVDLKQLAKDDDILISYHNNWLPLGSLNYRHRAYIKEDIISITFNGENASTWVVTLNVSTLSMKSKKYSAYPQSIDKPQNFSCNSLLIDSLLICTYVTSNALHNKLYNINSNVLVREDSITKSMFESLGNSTITKAGNFWSKSNISEIDFNEFLQIAGQNRIRISGYRKGIHLSLTYGTKYNRPPTSTLLANIVSLGMFSFSEVKTPPIIEFDVSYKLPDGKIENSTLENIVWDKMLMFVWGKRSFLGSFSFFYQKGFYYIGYYDNIAKKYFIHRFSETVQ